MDVQVFKHKERSMGVQRRVVIALFMLLALLILAPFGYMLIEGMGYNDNPKAIFKDRDLRIKTIHHSQGC